MKKIIFLVSFLIIFNLFFADTFAISSYNSYNINQAVDVKFSWNVESELESVWFSYYNLEKKSNEENLSESYFYKIPNLDKNVEKIINNLWVEKFKKLIDNQIIQFYWARNHCNWDISLNEKCPLTDKKELFTNIWVEYYYNINSSKEQKIKMQVYPFSTEKFVYFDINYSEEWKLPKIIFFDSSLDFYNLNVKFDKANYTISKWFEKKYKLLKFKNVKVVDYSWKEHIAETLAYIPYYETEIELKKWINKINLKYLKFMNDEKLINQKVYLK